MKTGFFNVLDVKTVIERLCAVAPMPQEQVLLDKADGRVLANAVYSAEDLPLAHRSCMDGYAVRATDLFGASESSPTYLESVGSVPVDQVAGFVLRPGQCSAIVTGGILPQGADAVIMVEHTQEMGAGTIEMCKSLAPYENVMIQGEDASAGKVALEAGTVLRPQEIGLLAGLGILSVTVHGSPRVGIFSTGDEVVPVHETPRVGQVRDINSHTLQAMVQRSAGYATCYGIVQDSCEAITTMLTRAAAENDVVLLSGGSSVGVRDLTMAALESLPDAVVITHGVAISPGKPLILASVPTPRGHCVIWGLPGQVTSAQVVMFVLGMPFLRHLAGEQTPFDQTLWPARRARLAHNLASRQGREDYVRIMVQQGEDALPLAVPVTGKSGLLRTMLQAQGVIRIPAASEGLDAGREVDVLLFGGSR